MKYANDVESGKVNPLEDLKNIIVDTAKKTTSQVIPTETVVEEKVTEVIPPKEEVNATVVEEKKEEVVKERQPSANEKMKNAVDDFLKK